MKCLPSQPLPCSRWQLVVKIFLLQLRQLTITRDSSIRRVGGENHPNLNLEEMTALNSLFIFAEYKKNLLFIEQQKFMPREAFHDLDDEKQRRNISKFCIPILTLSISSGFRLNFRITNPNACLENKLC
jgi:hypothetical protein